MIPVKVTLWQVSAWIGIDGCCAAIFLLKRLYNSDKRRALSILLVVSCPFKYMINNASGFRSRLAMICCRQFLG
ncbi:Uncharacterized protein HZ326_27561, partial [Fusarium oxysporum f. sp. albedinis]